MNRAAPARLIKGVAHSAKFVNSPTPGVVVERFGVSKARLCPNISGDSSLAGRLWRLAKRWPIGVLYACSWTCAPLSPKHFCAM